MSRLNSASLSNRWLSFAVTLCLSLLVTGCANQMKQKREVNWNTAIERVWQQAEPTDLVFDGNGPPTNHDFQSEPDKSRDHSFFEPGTGRMFSAESVAQARRVDGGDIKLNFQNANLLEVIKVILGDMLGITYVVDPTVQGTVSMQTNGALRRDDLIPTLELLLRMNEAALITDNGVYRVLPLALAITGARAPQLGDASLALPPGYSVRVVPLSHVAAEEMAQILEPFVTDTNQLVRVDTQRNLLILAANGGDMERLLETIRVFDVDRMSGMSVAMFTPDFVDAKTLAEELEKLLADPDKGLMAGLVRFILVERLNGLLVVTPRAEHLAQVREWVKRLDRDNGSVGRRLFIYRVQNGKAVELASTLSQLFNPDANSKPPAAEVAPGLTAVTVGDEEEYIDEEPVAGGRSANVAEGFSLGGNADVRIIADEPNNALLILASGIEYRQILTALQQLDISPMQVLVEVTIAEVSLSDDLKYGVEWFFNNQVGSSLTGFGALDLVGKAGASTLRPGFSYALTGGDGTVNAVINLLANKSNLSIVSSPSLLVLNNQQASIQVGDEVAISTQATTSNDTNNAPTVTNVEYRKTGVLLNVKPRINAGGLVIMEVEQETSAAKESNVAGSPTIQTRKITSTVAVNSGDTIILGGLIQDNNDSSDSGIPELHTIPVLGNLFGTTTDNQNRTELLVLITPRAVSNRASAMKVTEEFRRKLHSLVPVKQQLEEKAANPEKTMEPVSKPSVNSQTSPHTAPVAEQTSPAPTSAETVVTAPAGPATTTPSFCERIGPFESAAESQTALDQLNEGVLAELSENQQAINIGYRVVVTGFNGAEQAGEALQQLQTNGFKDALLYQAGPSRNTISLGVFSKRQTAEQMADKMRRQAYQIDIVEVSREQTRYWVDVQYPGTGENIDAWYRSLKTEGLHRIQHGCGGLASIPND